MYTLHAIAQYVACMQYHVHVPLVPSQQLQCNAESREAWQLALMSDELVVLRELSLDMHTLRVEKKLLLSFSRSIERSLGLSRKEAPAAVIRGKWCQNS